MYIRNLQIFSVCFSQYPKCILKLQALHFTFHFINTTYFFFFFVVFIYFLPQSIETMDNLLSLTSVEYNTIKQIMYTTHLLMYSSPKRFSLAITHTYVCHIYRELLRKLFSFKINTLYF